MNYYFVFVYDNIDPEIKGPFPSREIRDDEAMDMRREFDKNHSIYPLDISSQGKPTIKEDISFSDVWRNN